MGEDDESSPASPGCSIEPKTANPPINRVENPQPSGQGFYHEAMYIDEAERHRFHKPTAKKIDRRHECTKKLLDLVELAKTHTVGIGSFDFEGKEDETDEMGFVTRMIDEDSVFPVEAAHYIFGAQDQKFKPSLFTDHKTRRLSSRAEVFQVLKEHVTSMLQRFDYVVLVGWDFLEDFAAAWEFCQWPLEVNDRILKFDSQEVFTDMTMCDGKIGLKDAMRHILDISTEEIGDLHAHNPCNDSMYSTDVFRYSLSLAMTSAGIEHKGKMPQPGPAYVYTGGVDVPCPVEHLQLRAIHSKRSQSQEQQHERQDAIDAPVQRLTRAEKRRAWVLAHPDANKTQPGSALAKCHNSTKTIADEVARGCARRRSDNIVSAISAAFGNVRKVEDDAVDGLIAKLEAELLELKARSKDKSNDRERAKRIHSKGESTGDEMPNEGQGVSPKELNGG